ISDWRDETTRHGHLVGIDAEGRLRWDVELASGIGTSAVKLDDDTLAALVLASTWEIVVVDGDGTTRRQPLPSSATEVARLPDGSWVLGATGLARDKPSLYVVSGSTWHAVKDAAPQVPVVRATPDHVITVERTGDARE